MNEIEKQKHLDKFQKDVTWLRSAVPPDDIYDFAEQTLMACDYFIAKLNDSMNLLEEAEKDKPLGAWLKNVMGMRILRDMEYDGTINVTLKVPDEL